MVCFFVFKHTLSRRIVARMKRPAAAAAVGQPESKQPAVGRRLGTCIRARTTQGEALYRDRMPPAVDMIANTVAAWRSALAKCDISISHAVTINGTQHSFSLPEMKRLYTRRRRHMQGEVIMADWFNNLSAQERHTACGHKTYASKGP